MILQALGTIYGAVAARRRHWYDAHPEARRRLARPVISVGNLRVGGTGKTPVVGAVAALLEAAGERPAVLSRGYGRRLAPAGVTVVSDGRTVLATVAAAGDEPLMLARMLPRVPVLVCADRHLAGLLAERQFGATVHLLDDGFQHLALARDVDLLVADESDLGDAPIPAGRLREPLSAARAAHAVLVPGDDEECAIRLAARLGVDAAFRVSRTLGPARAIGAEEIAVAPDAPVFAVAAIARPERFFDDLRLGGWPVAGTQAFRDHHSFDQRDVDAVVGAARAAGARVVVTTAKDEVRLEGFDFGGVPALAVSLAVSIEPAGAFREWLIGRIAGARVAA